jgi:hypothetical protein
VKAREFSVEFINSNVREHFPKEEVWKWIIIGRRGSVWAGMAAEEGKRNYWLRQGHWRF